MATVRTLLLASAGFAGALLLLATCKQDTSKPTLQPQRPDPYVLVAEPPFAFHVALPGDAFAIMNTHLPLEEPMSAAWTGRRMLGPLAPNDVVEVVVSALDDRRPWSGAIVEGEDVLRLPLRREHVDAVASAIASYPAEGSFGAVRLPPAPPIEGMPPARAHLAWVDERGAWLEIGESLRGVVTSELLERTFGRDPLFITLEAAATRSFGRTLPVERVTARGKGLHDFTLLAHGLPGEGLPGLERLTEGALTHLLDTPQMAAGASVGVRDHDVIVRDVIAEAKARVGEQNFLIRGVLEDLLGRLNATLRAWNGRVLAGIGPADHLLVGLGSADVDKAERAALHLLRGVLDHLSLAETFGLAVPSTHFVKNARTVSGIAIHSLSIAGIRAYLPAQALPLLDRQNRLQVALAFPPTHGAAMLVAGPRAVEALSTWIGHAGPSPRTPANELVAATLALRGTSLVPLMRDSRPQDLLRLNAERQPTRLSLVRQGDALELRLVGPSLVP